MADKITEAVTACLSRLNADATMNTLGYIDGNVWWYHPPEGSAYPCVVLEKQTDHKEHRMGSIAFKRHWIVFKVVDGGEEQSSGDGGERARAISERIDTLLNGFKPTLTSGHTMQIQTDTGFEYSEAEVGNKFWYHVGSTFTFWIGE